MQTPFSGYAYIVSPTAKAKYKPEKLWCGNMNLPPTGFLNPAGGIKTENTLIADGKEVDTKKMILTK